MNNSDFATSLFQQCLFLFFYTLNEQPFNFSVGKKSNMIQY